MSGTVVAVVAAAGAGVRFGTSKTFALLLGRPVLAWTLQALADADEITEIIPVVKESQMAECNELIEKYCIRKIKGVVAGGAERHDSVMNGLGRVRGENPVVLVHDGVRPLVSREIVRRVLSGLEGYEGCICAAQPKDTIKELGAGGTVSRTLTRESLRAVQTPQAFRLRTLLEAYLKAEEEGSYSTDDSALVERAGGRVNVVDGSYRNIKITTPEDLEVARVFMQKPPGGADTCG